MFLRTDVKDSSMTVVKEFAVCLLLLLTQGTLADDEVFLDVLSANSSTVDLACRYVGEKTEVFFTVYKGSRSCIFYKSSCHYPQNDCNLQCKESGHEEVVSFLVNLDGSCQEKFQIRCSVKPLGGGQTSDDMDAFLGLTAQSDTPEIIVNNYQPVEFGLETVPIVCKIDNRCTNTKLEISGAHTAPIQISHKEEGSRFNTIAETTAIFPERGNYTITCKETEKGSYSKKNVIVELPDTGDPPVISVNDDQPVEADCKPVEIACTVTNSYHKAKLEIRSEVPMQLIHITHIEHGVRFNTTTKMKAIFNETGNYTIICKEIGKDDIFSQYYTLLVEPKTEKSWAYFVISISIMLIVTSIVCFIKRNSIKQMIDDSRSKRHEHRNNEEEAATHSLTIGPMYPDQDNRSQPSKNGNKEEKKDSIGSRYNHEKGMKMETELNRLLWVYAGSLHNEKTLLYHITETLTQLIRKGGNPFAPFEGTTAFSIFLEESATNEHELLMLSVSEFIEVASKSEFLNDMIKSVPRAILDEKSSHISSIKEVFVKKCHNIIDQNPSLRDLEDNYGRTPLHNLMEKICIDGAWKDMPKLIEGTDSLWDLMYELITTTNVNIKDKNDVTPYSWLSFWYGSVTSMDEPIWSKLSKKIEDVLAHLRDHGANVRYALQGRINITLSQARRKKFAKIQDTRGLTRDAQNQTQDKGSQHPEESEDGEKVDPLCLNTDAQNQAQENRSQHHEESEAGENADSFGQVVNQS